MNGKLVLTPQNKVGAECQQGVFFDSTSTARVGVRLCYDNTSTAGRLPYAFHPFVIGSSQQDYVSTGICPLTGYVWDVACKNGSHATVAQPCLLDWRKNERGWCTQS